MAVEGDCHGLESPFCGFFLELVQDILVSAVYAVEVADDGSGGRGGVDFDLVVVEERLQAVYP